MNIPDWLIAALTMAECIGWAIAYERYLLRRAIARTVERRLGLPATHLPAKEPLWT